MEMEGVLDFIFLADTFASLDSIKISTLFIFALICL